jgi:hypothetical protein
MTIDLSLEAHDVLVVRLVEAEQQPVLSVHPSGAGAASLRRTVDEAMSTGYGECFWPALHGGQYWWIFKRDEDRLETMAMWTRGGASQWEHVFRATDHAVWIHDRITRQLDRLFPGAGQ